MNFATDVIGRRDPAAEALVAIDRDGRRRTYSFGELLDRSGRLAGVFVAHGVRRGDLVMTVMGSSADWAIALLASFRLGAIALPCVAQSRPKDLALRNRIAQPALVVTTPEHESTVADSRPGCPVIVLPDERLLATGRIPRPAELAPRDPALIIFTSGTSGEPKAVVHGTSYLFGQSLQAEHWLDTRPGDLVWCTAAAGWSKSARNSLVAPWLRGARALLHDARFDPIERVGLLRRERVQVLCMAPTEYRMTIRRADLGPLPDLRSAVAAGEPLDADAVLRWREATGVEVRDGYGQTETGAVTAIRPDDAPRPGSMGRPLPGLTTWIEDGQLRLDPVSSPTFCLGYLGQQSISGPWATGDLVDRDEEGYLWFRGRADDVIVSAGYRIGPAEVEAALLAHPAVAEAAVVGAPDPDRGQVVRAVVVPAAEWAPGPELARVLQEHVKTSTAPYKYPRRVDFAVELPRTPSGKVRRAALRADAR